MNQGRYRRPKRYQDLAERLRAVAAIGLERQQRQRLKDGKTESPTKKKRRCSTCGQLGHNKRTCK